LNHILRLRNNPNSAQRTKVIPDVFGSKAVLLLLVSRNAVASFFNSQRAQPRRFAQSRASHGLAETIDFGLVETDQLGLGAVSGFHHVSRLLDGNEIFVYRHGKTPKKGLGALSLVLWCFLYPARP